MFLVARRGVFSYWSSFFCHNRGFGLRFGLLLERLFETFPLVGGLGMLFVLLMRLFSLFGDGGLFLGCDRLWRGRGLFFLLRRLWLTCRRLFRAGNANQCFAKQLALEGVACR